MHLDWDPETLQKDQVGFLAKFLVAYAAAPRRVASAGGGQRTPMLPTMGLYVPARNRKVRQRPCSRRKVRQGLWLEEVFITGGALAKWGVMPWLQ